MVVSIECKQHRTEDLLTIRQLRLFFFFFRRIPPSINPVRIEAGSLHVSQNDLHWTNTGKLVDRLQWDWSYTGRLLATQLIIQIPMWNKFFGYLVEGAPLPKDLEDQQQRSL